MTVHVSCTAVAPVRPAGTGAPAPQPGRDGGGDRPTRPEFLGRDCPSPVGRSCVLHLALTRFGRDPLGESSRCEVLALSAWEAALRPMAACWRSGVVFERRVCPLDLAQVLLQGEVNLLNGLAIEA